jgi:competence protein ComEC
LGAVPLAAAWNVSRPLSAERREALCANAKVLVIRIEADWSECPKALVLGGQDFARGGAAEIYQAEGRWRVVWAQDLRGRRPWTWGPDYR